MMKTITYYLGFTLVPVLFVINFAHSLLIAFHNAVVATGHDIDSHKRWFNKR